MADEVQATMEERPPAEPARGGKSWPRRWAHRGAVALIAMALAFGVLLLWIDSPSGHRLVVRQIAALTPQSGLRIEIGQIEGSLYDEAVLHNVRLSDPDGLFFSAQTIRLKWWPLAWLSNRLEIDSLAIPRARLLRLPRLRSTGPRGKVLPNFDIRIMQFGLDRLMIDRAVTGRSNIFTLSGDVDIRGGKAVVDLSGRALFGKDRLLLALDSRPDDNRFDVDLTVNAPANGLIAAVTGLSRDTNLRLEGDGDWAKWDGQFVATLADKSAAGLNIHLRGGRFNIDGTVASDAIATRGALARLTTPQLTVKATGKFADKLISGHFSARSDAMTVKLDGGLFVDGRGYDNLRIDLGLQRPQALLRDFDVRALVARMRFNGPMASARFEYLLRAGQMRLGTTTLQNVKAQGQGRMGAKGRPTVIPLRLSAQSISGQGDLVASMLANISITGQLRKNGDVITSGPLAVRSDKVDGELATLFDLKTGKYDLALGGRVDGLVIPGFGVVDVRSRLQAVPNARGAFSLTGHVDAAMRRLDNDFLRTIAGGLPTVRTGIALGVDGRLHFRKLMLRAPQITLAGEGVRDRDKSVNLAGTGVHTRYGPLKLILSGQLEHPTVDLMLARPFNPASLADVHLLLDPVVSGYDYHASGQSILGPFDTAGAIALPQGAQAAITVDMFKVNGSEGQGRLLVEQGGLSGRLLLSGATHGSVDLAVPGGIQTVDAALRLDEAHFAGIVPINILSGRLNAKFVLNPTGTGIDATLAGRGMQAGRFRINRFAANARFVDGAGKLRVNISGHQGRPFDMQLDTDIAADEIGLRLAGSLNQRQISLDHLARFSRVEGGWALDPVTLRYGGGAARINAAAYGVMTRLDVNLERMPLSLLDLSNADLGLSGTASGRFVYARQRDSAPTGSAGITVNGLSRSGVTRTSTPIDMGLNAELTHKKLAVRTVASINGAVIGRGQALMSPLGSGSLIDRLRAAPVRAQVRYVGPAEAVWRMSRIEIIDVTGQVALKADVAGTGADPVITGALMTRDAALESPVTGMRLSHLQSRAQFDGSKLVFSQLGATARNGGHVSGTGSFDFSLGQGVGIDLALRADNAELLDRDDIGATVNGPISIRSGGRGGIIGGDFDVVHSRFTLGHAAAIAEIPQLQVIEKNGRPDDFASVDRGADWKLDIKANARNRLMVNGLGLASEWRMNLSIDGSVTNPRLNGRADLVRGTYDFAGRRFDLKSGSLRFNGSVPANPTLDLTAEATLSDLAVTIRITGTSAHPIIGFSSVPAMPQEEVLSRILFGSSITQLSAPEALQLASAVASLQGGGGGLDPINALRKAAGLDRLRILPADPTNGQNTSIGAGKYLTRKVYVELITDGQGYSATRVEYQVTRWLSLLSSISTLGREGVTARVSKDY